MNAAVTVYTYYIDEYGYISRVREDGYSSMWLPSKKEWSDTWAPREMVEEGQVRAGLKPWSVYNGPMPEGSLPAHRCAFPAQAGLTLWSGQWACLDCGDVYTWTKAVDPGTGMLVTAWQHIGNDHTTI